MSNPQTSTQNIIMKSKFVKKKKTPKYKLNNPIYNW
jgi:hypothetical protein